MNGNFIRIFRTRRLTILVLVLLVWNGTGLSFQTVSAQTSEVAERPGKRSRNTNRPIPKKWRRATQRECRAETDRELQEMERAGIYGDSPNTLGFASFTFNDDGTMSGKSMDPCGYTDGIRFRPRYTITERSKSRVVTKAEFDAFEKFEW